ncbi:baculoviral IAP repeat-containing protein 1 [Emydura macquarii macquarii]|uniref:baculoviral IAP repeat-containing protein 1 n=1 Tax=Emydura macquarii macquarii TaxID=1129001 RepID=UPI00352A8018
MRSECQRLKTFLSYNSVSSWSPAEMAAAGFYHTGVKSSVQCFCCGLVLFRTLVKSPPYVEHKKFQPKCEFILGKDVGNISKFDIRIHDLEKNTAERTDRYKEEAARLKSFDNWPFYAKGTAPALLASVGFFFTGEKDKVQCFACGGCLGNWEEGDDPWKEHAKWFPECEFLQSKKTNDEIKEYIQNYCGFAGVMGKHFTASLVKKILPTETGDAISNIFEDEGVRLDSFKNWPQEAHADATALAKAGFFYTGERDKVQCFACGVCLEKWEEGDDPWKEHAKWFSHCKYAEPLSKTSVKQPESQSTLQSVQETTCKANLEETEALNSAVTGMALDEHEWLQEAKNLTEQLTEAYSDTSFRKCFSFGDSTHFAIDLKSLYGDLSIVSKDISNQPQQQFLLPEVLANFNSITVLEGEAGSGKTALLRKIAILWASGCCPILSRFRFVFYFSLTSVEWDHSMADIICKQLVGLKESLSEESLMNMIQQLKNKVLFLLDDYGEMNSVPRVIEELIQKNHFNKHCLVIAVRTNRIKGIRQYANTILNIMEFPLCSTLYVLKKLFSHNIALVEKFIFQLTNAETMQTILKMPILVVALCAYWVQYPGGTIFSDKAIFKAYLLFNSLKYLKERDHVAAIVSTCGELALKGLFKPCFDFSEEDLAKAGISGDEALRLGLLSKFTAQRLRPVYQFFHPSFQEFLAGIRMSELLDSDVQDKLERGLFYLQQINTFRKVAVRHSFLLKYACSYPSKAVPKIVSYLFNLIDSKESFENQSENNDHLHLKQHPELQIMEQMIDVYTTILPECLCSFFIQYLLNFANDAAYESNTVAACAPVIFQFLSGKTLSLGQFVSQNSFLLQFFQDYPESLSLLSSLEILITGTKNKPKFDFSHVETCYSELEVPTVDQDYALAFTLLNDVVQKVEKNENDISSFWSLIPRCLPDNIMAPFMHVKGFGKIPLLKFVVSDTNLFQESDLRNLMVLFSISDHIELQLDNSHGLIESIRPAIELYKESFKKCSIRNCNLSVAEQELLLSMSSVESLEIKEKAQVPVSLFSNLDKFICLKEFSVYLHNGQNIFDIIPNGFKNLYGMEKLLINNVKFECGSSRLAEFIQNFQNLCVFHLNHLEFFDFDCLLTAISSCNKLTELKLTGSFFRDCDIFSFAAALPNFLSLKVLDLDRQHFTDKEGTEAFASALGFLVNLEELILPIGAGISHTAKLIVQQCPHLPYLRHFSFTQSLNDDSLLEIAKVATNGGFQKLESLSLSANHNVTEAGWRNFFQTLANMPNLSELNINRLYTHQIKSHATTVKSFVQCVSVLPSLVTIQMWGWLLDEEDLKMFNVMKEQHPQSKSLRLWRQWMLPFSPIVQE